MTAPASLGTLFGNFRAIYDAFPGTDELPLYSIDGVSLVQTGGVAGFALSFFNNLPEAVQFTAQLYDQLQETWLAPQLRSYKRHLDALRHGCDEINEEHQQSGLHVQEWFQNTWGFIELVESEANPKLQKLFADCITVKKPFTEKYKTELRSYAAISRLESLGRMPLPLQDWLLMTHFQTKKSSYAHHEKWLGKLMNNGVDTVTHFDVYQGLEGVASYFRNLDLECKATAVTILYSFNENGYRWFLVQPDPVHMEWRNKLAVGAALGKYRITGIYPESFGESKKKVVKLNDCRYVARIFENRILPFVYQYSLTLEPLEVPILEIVEVDPEGRFMIQERIDDPTSTLNFPNIKTIDAECEYRLQTPIKIMQYFITDGWCPSISLGYFRLTSDGKMRVLKPYDRMSYWLEPFENYSLEISRGKPLIYQYLIRAIGIKESRIYKCYEGAVENFAMGVERYPVRSIASVHLRGAYEDWMKGMTKLYERIQSLRKQVMHRYAVEKNTALDSQKLYDAIMGYYDTSCSIAQLPRNAEDEIFRLVS